MTWVCCVVKQQFSVSPVSRHMKSVPFVIMQFSCVWHKVGHHDVPNITSFFSVWDCCKSGSDYVVSLHLFKVRCCLKTHSCCKIAIFTPRRASQPVTTAVWCPLCLWSELSDVWEVTDEPSHKKWHVSLRLSVFQPVTLGSCTAWWCPYLLFSLCCSTPASPWSKDLWAETPFL